MMSSISEESFANSIAVFLEVICDTLLRKGTRGDTGHFIQVTILFNQTPPSLSCKIYLCSVSI